MNSRIDPVADLGKHTPMMVQGCSLENLCAESKSDAGSYAAQKREKPPDPKAEG
jgi:hypothetical protein